MQIQHLGLVDYASTAAAMRAFSEARSSTTEDELWLCQHPPVYTLGIASNASHVLNPGNVPVVASTRGGQVTYHGPGQIVAYPLINLKRAGFFVKEYVFRLEESVLRTLAEFGIVGHRVASAPGIYVRITNPRSHAMLAPHAQQQSQPHAPTSPSFDGLAKIAALGVKVTNGCTYHGLALNVHMDLAPYQGINPCGYAALATTDLHTIGVDAPLDAVQAVLAQQLAQRLRA